MKKSDAQALAIQLLGGFHVRVRGTLVADAQWPRRQAKQLVKLLALIPKHQLHRQQLIDAICPDLNAESGAANLHKIIHLARHALEPSLKAGAKSQFVVTHQQQVQLRAPGELWIDVEQFERLSDGRHALMRRLGLRTGPQAVWRRPARRGSLCRLVRAEEGPASRRSRAAADATRTGLRDAGSTRAGDQAVRDAGGRGPLERGSPSRTDDAVHADRPPFRRIATVPPLL